MSSSGLKCSSDLNRFLFNSMNRVGVTKYGAIKMFICVSAVVFKQVFIKNVCIKNEMSLLYLLYPLFWLLQTLRKKGFNGCNSPEPDNDDSIDQSPLNDRKTDDLDSLFKRYGVSTVTLWSPYLTFSFCSSLSLSALFLSISLCPLFFLVFGERRLWTRKSIGTLRAQTPRSPSPSPLALKRNTKKLTRSLIKWCRTIGCQWVPPTSLCNPAPPPPSHLIPVLCCWRWADGFWMLMAIWLLTEHLPSPLPHPFLPHFTFYQHHLSPSMKSLPSNCICSTGCSEVTKTKQKITRYTNFFFPKL